MRPDARCRHAPPHARHPRLRHDRRARGGHHPRRRHAGSVARVLRSSTRGEGACRVHRRWPLARLATRVRRWRALRRGCGTHRAPGTAGGEPLPIGRRAGRPGEPLAARALRPARRLAGLPRRHVRAQQPSGHRRGGHTRPRTRHAARVVRPAVLEPGCEPLPRPTHGSRAGPRAGRDPHRPRRTHAVAVRRRARRTRGGVRPSRLADGGAPSWRVPGAGGRPLRALVRRATPRHPAPGGEPPGGRGSCGPAAVVGVLPPSSTRPRGRARHGGAAGCPDLRAGDRGRVGAGRARTAYRRGETSLA